MSNVKRVFVEKKKDFAMNAKSLENEIIGYLGIKTVSNVRVLIRYDVENLSEETYKKALTTVFSEPPVDNVYEGTFTKNDDDFVFSVEYLPGQFDQRADSAEQCVKFFNENETPVIKTATTYVISGKLTEEEKEKIKENCINPVDSREALETVPETLVTEFKTPADVKIFDGFTAMNEADLKDLYDSLGLAMTFNDFKFIQEHFAAEEKRDPSMTEIRVLDTYWSDHCRHTTFATELKDIKFDEGKYKAPIEATFKKYLADRESVYAGRKDKFICLMDLGTLAAKKLKKMGLLDDQEESEEINACSIVVPVEIDGKTEEWLVNFKNETHNHPTEIEPFGGAATCLGGAIRDPLSGRTYVYQAMRITGAADPTVPVSETMHGKLPQRKLVTGAAHGYSSYGNQIGLATGYVKELYHPDYVAKRMEIGAVMAAAPRAAVKRESSDPGDIIILLGGRTGRDGCGGATGSSKVHTEKSIEECGAEVQKGNAPTERKMQRLFRRPEVTKLIKKCNDFGAGGVSVAIGELADGLRVDLDKVPKKYEGLDGTELSISESQERMAVVVDPKDVKEFLAYSAEENLEAIEVAVVTEEPRLVLTWRGKDIVNISRAFLDTNGAHQETCVEVEMPVEEENVLTPVEVEDVRASWLKVLGDLNECSQKGLVERFDSSIGAGTVTMPYGGKYQLTETQAMVAKLPVLKGKCDTVTMMSYGFDPFLSKWSPYHGAMYAVVDSVAKIVATGGDYKKIRFTFQEYFRRMSEDPKRWSQPFAALLGAYEAQMEFGLPSIGGKDSMSGTFEDIDVPPTLCSFAIDIAKESDIVTPELKAAGNVLVRFDIAKDQYDLPNFTQLKEMYSAIHELTLSKAIVSAYVLDAKGLVPAVSKMAFGNKLGVALDESLAKKDLFSPSYGCIVAEVPADRLADIKVAYTKVGEVTAEAKFTYKNVSINLEEALSVWSDTLESVFPTKASKETDKIEAISYDAKEIHICKNRVAKPTVFIPVFPGTNCEYDSARAFENAGANTIVKVFKNLDAASIRESVDEFSKAISQSQIIMFPGGFSAGDEPDGSAKFFATAFRNEKMKEEVTKLLNERDGLALGICNGFQALIKLGLVPNGEITGQDSNSPTLTYNTINRHISKMAYIRVASNKSPWLAGAKLGGVYTNPASHGEGRFVAPKEWLDKLIANGQVATQYCDLDGNVSMDEEWNINGSYMAIEGITSPDGRCLGKMAHSERRGDSVAINIYGEQDLKIFESGVKYFL
ncbi:phosphoribosylformylglycinamidine synthase [Lachnospira multipara]|uniref:Phosphoribosylformylglycinamidine synthase n=1 Tax=Lachnospira multipara TaxID=28051 RepID=A0A1H5SFG3_9FIRM|nr:phosphoribosylformylglycinamidine synthase [Lachnospira multipara]SEF48718.1 phosphoribosylformylglycinamidine synthase [Lachnospira multipara]